MTLKYMIEACEIETHGKGHRYITSHDTTVSV